MYTRNSYRISVIVSWAICMCASGLAVAPEALGRDRVETLLQTLADAPGPSGYEEEVRAIMVRELKPPRDTDKLRWSWLGTCAAWNEWSKNHAGCAVVVEVMRRLVAEGHPNILIVAATTQEETGVRGAHTAADVVHPDIGIAIEGGVNPHGDGTLTDNQPG